MWMWLKIRYTFETDDLMTGMNIHPEGSSKMSKIVKWESNDVSTVNIS